MAELIGRSNMPHSRLTAFCVSGRDRNLSAFLSIVRRERASATRSFILFASSSIYSHCQNVFYIWYYASAFISHLPSVLMPSVSIVSTSC